MELHEILKKLRIEKGVTQQTVADAIGIGQSGYAKFETGTKNPSFETLINLSKYYGKSIDYLLGQTNNPVIETNYDLLLLIKEKVHSSELSKEDMVKIIQVLSEELGR